MKRVLIISLFILAIGGLGMFFFLSRQTHNVGIPSLSNAQPTPTPTSPFTISMQQSEGNKGALLQQGNMLGTRPLITGVLGWTLKGVKGNSALFKRAKDLGMTDVRIMSVLSGKDDWSLLDNVINLLHTNGQTILLCLGNPTSPKISKATIDQNAATLTDMINHLVSVYGVNGVNAMPIELDNEYGAANLSYLMDTYYQAIKKAQDNHPGLTIRIIVPSTQRGDYDQLSRALAYIKQQQIPLYGISVHYYLRGAKKTEPNFSFSIWLSHIQEITKTYGYSNLPLYLTEYGLSGIHSDVQLKESFNAAWLASRLGDSTYYNNRNIIYYMSALYGQPFTYPHGGWIGLYVGYGGKKNTPYPIAREFELESRFGTNTLYALNGIPSENAGIGGVTDGKGQWLIWNTGNTSFTFQIPTSQEKQIGIIDSEHGNSNSLLKKNSNLSVDLVEKRTNPFADANTGIINQSITPINNTIETTIHSHGVVFIGNK